MESRKKMFLLIFLGVFLANSVSSGTEAEGLDKIRKEYFQDLSRVRELRREKNLEGLDKLACELEKKWFAKNKENYGYMLLEICGAFGSSGFKTDIKYDLGRKYAMLALEKSAKLKEKNQIPIEVEFSLLGHLQSIFKLKEAAKSKDWPNKRNAMAKLYFHAWHRLEKTIDKNWDPNDASLVPPRPPAGVDRGWSGMSPQAIKDPNLRTEYEEALEEHRHKKILHSKQRCLRELKKWDLPYLQKDLLRLYSGPLFDSKKLEIVALQEDLEKLIEDKEVRTTILNGLQKKLLEISEPKPKDKGGRRGRSEARPKGHVRMPSQ